jgi:hypothetical protein
MFQSWNFRWWPESKPNIKKKITKFLITLLNFESDSFVRDQDFYDWVHTL